VVEMQRVLALYLKGERPCLDYIIAGICILAFLGCLTDLGAKDRLLTRAARKAFGINATFPSRDRKGALLRLRNGRIPVAPPNG